MAQHTEGLVYKDHPLRRVGNMIYYGSMADPYIILMQVTVGGYYPPLRNGAPSRSRCWRRFAPGRPGQTVVYPGGGSRRRSPPGSSLRRCPRTRHG